MSTCYTYSNPDFKPTVRLIASITQGNPATITTAISIDTIAQPNIIDYGIHDYVSGTIARLYIPESCGMPQANGLTGTITVTGANTFTIDIDTTEFSPFAIPTNPNVHTNTCAMVVPIGEDNSILSAAVQNTLPH
jgi:hypothetical protein